MTILDEFMKTEWAQAEMSKTAAREKGQYDVTPNTDGLMHEAHPGGGTETMVAGGKGGMGVYDVKGTKMPGGSEYADHHVEDLHEVASKMEEVARKDPKGQPFGTAGNESLKWAADKGKKLSANAGPKPLTHKASVLKRLAELADVLDGKGLHDEAAQIDAIIADEAKIVTEK